MKTLCTTVALTLATAWLIPLAVCQEADPTEQKGWANNAALTYWKAFALLPALDDADHKLLTSPTSTPINDRMREIAAKGETSLQLLHKAATIGPCDWGNDLSEGFDLQLPHLSKARELARFAALRARVRFADKENDDATKDLIASLVLSHHVSSDGILIDLLVEWAIHRLVMETTAANVASLSTSQRSALTEKIAELPEPTPLPSACPPNESWPTSMLKGC